MRRTALSQLIFLTAAAGLGLSSAIALHIQNLQHATYYVPIATGLLCWGLYSVGYGIDLAEARREIRVVLLGITVGVLAKYAIIATIACAVTRDWRYLVIAMAVAAIDPLSVDALTSDRRMSVRARTVLKIWASWDDPVSALAIIPIITIASSVTGHSLPGASWSRAITSLAPFAAAAVGIGLFVLWRRTSIGSGLRSERIKSIELELRLQQGEGPLTALVQGGIALGVMLNAPSLPALVALRVRPAWLGGELGRLLTKIAMAGATFLLGILLSGGVLWTGGIALGVATYLSQVVVGWGILLLDHRLERTRSQFSRRDAWHLALGQQNGITAIVIALVLQPQIPTAVASISLAIVVVAALQFSCNAAFDKFYPGPQSAPEESRTSESSI